MNIHPTAIIDPSARLEDSVSVGAYAVIGPDVTIGNGSWIGPHVVINGPTSIGCENKIFQFSSIGEVPQDKKYDDEPTRLEIGDRNTIREFVTINRGTIQDEGATRIGNDNWIMAYVHIAHDCIVGNNIIFSNNASLAGHVSVGDYAILSGFTLVHQFCAIGAHCFTGMGSSISKDVPPYLMISGSPSRPYGVNTEGLKRRNFSAEEMKAIRQAYKVLYRNGLSLDEAKQKLSLMADEYEVLKVFSEFLGNSERSIIR